MLLENPYIFDQLRDKLLRLWPEQRKPASTFEEALDRIRNEWVRRGGCFVISDCPGRKTVYCFIGLQTFGRGEARTRDEAEAEALLKAMAEQAKG